MATTKPRLSIQELRAAISARLRKPKLERRALRDSARDIRQGDPAEYAGDHPWLCNARTKNGHFCRHLKGCPWHREQK